MSHHQLYKPAAFISEEPVVTGLLNQALRNQISLLNQQPATSVTLQQSFLAIAEQALTEDRDTALAAKLFVDAYEQAMKVLGQAQLHEAEMTTQYINQHGLVMSVLNCTTTIKDVHRNTCFYKGLFELINDLLQRDSQINIVYPACGPFAPLLLPILLYMDQKKIISPDKVRISLVDIQLGAVKSLKLLVNKLQLNDYIDGIYEADAALFKGDKAFDIFIAEAFQHGFSKEAHLSICKNFASQLSHHGVMLPCKVMVNAALVNCQREYIEQFQQPQSDAVNLVLNQDILNERVELGNILTLDRHSLLTLDIVALGEQQVVRCNTVSIPQTATDACERTLVLYAEVMTYNGHWLQQYQSGITHPLPLFSVCIDFVPKGTAVDDLLLTAKDKIAFYYKLTGLTGFLPTKADEEVHHGAN
ncbi:hypothetical protein EU508_20520 [Pseudoalteromonas fuliginea]|uniref:Uncharacterized protein n=1 Tax=Pseudoalteromonas fuliginea TaxID=1872678 RepID=A0AB73BBH9_9GAMM|nr:hypothetical protein [Pseudoalteromonas fuliginea]KAA1156471.1 hypothetical protein EU508_20520 [Pseudoalteromonas fuliginea]